MCNQLSTLRILDEARNLSARKRDKINSPLFRLLYKDISRHPDQYDLEDVTKKAKLYIERNNASTATPSDTSKIRNKHFEFRKLKEERRLQVINNNKVWNSTTALEVLKADGLLSLARTILLKSPKDIEFLVKVLADSLEEILFSRNSMLYILKVVYGENITVRNTRMDVNCYYCGCKKCETNLVKVEFYDKEVTAEPCKPSPKGSKRKLGGDNEPAANKKRATDTEKGKEDVSTEGRVQVKMVSEKIRLSVCPRLSIKHGHVCPQESVSKPESRDKMSVKYVDGFIEFIKPIIDALNADVRKRSTRHKATYTSWGVFDFKESKYKELIELQFSKCPLRLKDIKEKIS